MKMLPAKFDGLHCIKCGAIVDEYAPYGVCVDCYYDYPEDEEDDLS